MSGGAWNWVGGEEGRLWEELVEGKEQSKYIVWRKNVFNRKEGIKNHALTQNCGKKKKPNQLIADMWVYF